MLCRGNLLKHLRNVHKLTPAALGKLYACECGKQFKTEDSRRAHRGGCPVWQQLHGGASRQATADRRADAASIETFEHFWSGNCAAFKHDRTDFNSYVDALLRRLDPTWQQQQTNPAAPLTTAAAGHI